MSVKLVFYFTYPIYAKVWATTAKWFCQFLCLASFRLKREKVCDPDCAQSISMSSSVWPWITDNWPKLKPAESWWNLLTKKKKQIKNSAMLKYAFLFLSYLGIRAKIDQGIRISVLHAAKAPIRLSCWDVLRMRLKLHDSLVARNNPCKWKNYCFFEFLSGCFRLTAQQRFTFAKLTEKYNISCPSWLLSDLLRHLGHQLRKDEGQVPVKELNLFRRVFRVIWMKNHKLKMATYYIGNIVQHVYIYIIIYLYYVCVSYNDYNYNVNRTVKTCKPFKGSSSFPCVFPILSYRHMMGNRMTMYV